MQISDPLNREAGMRRAASANDIQEKVASWESVLQVSAGFFQQITQSCGRRITSPDSCSPPERLLRL